MAGIAVKGTYHNGVIEWEGTVQVCDGKEALVAFLEQQRQTEGRTQIPVLTPARYLAHQPMEDADEG